MSKMAQHVVEVASDGRISQRKTVAEALADDPELSAEFAVDKEATEKADEIADGSREIPEDERKKDVEENVGKLIADEEIALGHVSATSSESALF